VEGRAADPLPSADEHRGVDYRRVTLGRDHVLASAAIPVAFPAVRIDDGPAGAWYLDGGVRLNVPLKPAIELGVDKLVVVATAPLRTPAAAVEQAEPHRPDVFDAAADVVHAALVDRMVEDVRTLAAANEQSGLPRGRVIPYMFAGPHEPGEVARFANDVFHGRSAAGLGLDLRLLHLLLGGGAISRGELLSYLFFEPDFIEGAIALGASDAWRLLASVRGGLPWQTS
jgi:NTE family protein